MSSICAVADRDVVRVHGTDAAGFLQGQISQDVDTIAAGRSAWSLLLAPQGKVEAWFRLTRDRSGHGFLIDLDKGFAATLVARLERFRLRVDVTFEVLTGWRMVSLRSTLPSREELDSVRAELITEVNWPGFDGVDLLGPEVELLPGLVNSPAELEVARIRAGWPAMGRELTERTIPAEIGGLVETSVSFTKGCYTGQELVARIDSRGGNVPRPVRLLEIATGSAESSDDAQHSAGAFMDVSSSSAADAPGAAGDIKSGTEVIVDGRVVGEITSVATDTSMSDTSTSVTVALATVQRRIQPPAQAEVAGVAATVLATPATTLS